MISQNGSLMIVRLSLVFLICVFFPNAKGALHPVISNPKIYSCQDSPPGSCNQLVYYSHDGTTMINITPAGSPSSIAGTKLQSLGLHCQYLRPGGQFDNCEFNDFPGHAPSLLTECTLRSTSSWELTPLSTCVTRTQWGPHSGAGPGGECILFVQTNGWNRDTATTIYGVVTATQVANSHNTFCQKPLPPNVTCDVVIPDEINHGTISPMEQNTASIRGALDCGTSPRVELIGGEKLTLGDGVTTVLTIDTSVRGVIKLTSSLTTNGAAAGAYQRSTVMVVSPQ
jgi:hypothetical protein